MYELDSNGTPYAISIYTAQETTDNPTVNLGTRITDDVINAAVTF